MKITFILSSIGLSGGVKAVFEFANQLCSRGHDVSVVYPLATTKSPRGEIRMSLAESVKRFVKRFKQGARVGWFDLKANLLSVPTLAEKYIPDGDVIIATWWRTAYHVSRYSHKKGHKFYLVQHYEIWGGPEEDVNDSYKLGLRIIINSTWLKNTLQQKLNVKGQALIPHAPDWDYFYPEERGEKADIVRVLMPYRNIKWKGIKDGIEAFEIVRSKYSKVQLVMFGPHSGKDVPEFVEFHENPDNNELRRIYNSCDIFLYPSHYEGFGMPPMEAMACGVACIVTNVGAVPDYTIPGKTAIVVPPRDPNSIAEACMELLENREKREQIASAGHEHIRQFTWPKAAEQLEIAFHEAMNEN